MNELIREFQGVIDAFWMHNDLRILISEVLRLAELNSIDDVKHAVDRIDYSDS